MVKSTGTAEGPVQSSGSCMSQQEMPTAKASLDEHIVSTMSCELLCPAKMSDCKATEFKSAKLAAKRLLENRQKKPADGLSGKAVAKADPPSKLAVPNRFRSELNCGIVPKGIDNSSAPVLNSSIVGEFRLMQLNNGEGNADAPASKQAEIKKVLPHTGFVKAKAIPVKGIRVPSPCRIQSEKIVTSGKVITHKPTTNGPKMSRIPEPLVAISKNSELKKTQPPPASNSPVDHVLQQPSGRLLEDATCSAAPVDALHQEVPQLATISTKEGVHQGNVSKVASLAKSFENLMLTDSLADRSSHSTAHLQRGSFRNSSLPLDTIHSTKLPFRERGNIPVNSCLPRTVPDHNSNAACRSSSFRKFRRGPEDKPRPRVLVRRANSLVGQTSPVCPKPSDIECDGAKTTCHVSVGSIVSKFSGAAQDSTPVSTNSGKEGLRMSASPNGGRKLSAVQMAVMNLEARSQAALEKGSKLSFSSSTLEPGKLSRGDVTRCTYGTRDISSAGSPRKFHEFRKHLESRQPVLPAQINGSYLHTTKTSSRLLATGESDMQNSPLDVVPGDVNLSTEINLSPDRKDSSNEQPSETNVVKLENSRLASDSRPSSGQGAVRPNSSFLWTGRQTTRPPVNGSCDQLFDSASLTVDNSFSSACLSSLYSKLPEKCPPGE